MGIAKREVPGKFPRFSGRQYEKEPQKKTFSHASNMRRKLCQIFSEDSFS
jgi:hypothetical protein